MANNFYNMNISRYNPAEHSHHPVNMFSPSAPADNYENQSTEHEQNNIVYPDFAQTDEGSSHSRLNALDSTILINEAYQNIDDEVFKTEYQISKLEEGIRALDSQIEQAKSISDYAKVDVLTMRKHAMQDKLKELSSSYGSQDVSAKLSDGITSIFSSTKAPTFLTKAVDACVNFMSDKVLPRISKKYDSGRNIKSALHKLETLNKNVDELVTMQMPYGEADERYDMLTNYLNRANVIHFNISKTVGTPMFFDTISSIDKEKFEAVRKNSSNFGNMTSRPSHHKVNVPGQEGA